MSEFDNLIKKRAVALKYDSKNNRAPIIVASGMGYLCLLYTSESIISQTKPDVLPE